MARIDDYLAAKRLAVEALSTQSVDTIARRTQFSLVKTNVLRVPFLDRVYRISFPEFSFQDEQQPDTDVSIQEQVLILHYLQVQELPMPSRNWVAYREIPGAAFYFSAFVKRAVDPLKKTFGGNAAALGEASRQLEGEAVEPGDAAFEFKLFPHVSVRLILWEGDAEFPPEASILFDDTISMIFVPEDIAWLTGMLVYRLIAIFRQSASGQADTFIEQKLNQTGRMD